MASAHDDQSTPSRSARDAAIRIVRVLQEAGHVAYFAGGCVRDMLLGQSAADYDVATDAHPEQVMQHFPKARLVGEAFGVALVRMYRHDVEVATFRTECRRGRDVPYRMGVRGRSAPGSRSVLRRRARRPTA